MGSRRRGITRSISGSAEPATSRALVAVSPSGGKGGAETMLLRVTEAAIARGWRVQCLVPAGPLQAALRQAGAVVQEIPALGLGSTSKVSSYSRLLAAILRAAILVRAAARHADVVLANGVLTLPAVVCAPRPATRVWWAHDVLVRRDRLLLARWCSRRLDVVVGVSAAVLGPLTGLPVRQVLVRNGVDAAPDELRVAPGSPPHIIGCTAALTPWKGQDVLLEAVALLGREDVRVELLGAAPSKDAGYEGALRHRAEQADLHGRVDFLGHVSAPLDIMRRWRVGVSASVDPEASGLGVLEGMSLGVPQVATDHGGPKEVLDGAGLLVSPGDAADMARALERLLDDDNLWRRCSSSGPANVSARLHRPQQEQAFLDVLGEAPRSSTGRSRPWRRRPVVARGGP